MSDHPAQMGGASDGRVAAAKERRLRILEHQLDYIRAEMLHLLQERDRLVYSASWFVYRPLRAFEKWLVDLFSARRPLDPRRESFEVGPVAAEPPSSPDKRAKPLPNRLLIDVTGTVRRDMATGIERVVKNVVKALYETKDAAFPAIAVRCENGRLFTCGDFVRALTGARQPADTEILLQPGDRFLMLSDSWNAFETYAPLFERIRGSGGEIVTCLFDLIPELYPYGCHEVTPPLYRTWLRKALVESDAFIAISQTVAEELASYIDERALAHSPQLKIGWFRCGSDIPAPAQGKLRAELANALSGPAPVFLCVGTLEPRKGHRAALEAFDLLWAKGMDARLMIVGRNGWYAEALIAQIRRHPEFGDRLFWFDDVADAELSALYEASSAVLCPSYAEGFGLPIVEAARRGRPAICSDIPVFREVGGGGAAFFRATDPLALAQCVEDMMRGKIDLDLKKVKCATWADAARRIVDVVMREQWIERKSPRDVLPAWPVVVECDRTRRLECELEWLQAEMLLLVHERETMTYSASWRIFSPLRRFEAGLVRIASALIRRVAPRTGVRPDAKTRQLEEPFVVASPADAKRLLIDVTGVVKQDAGAGIQRVVKNLLRAFQERGDSDLPAVAVYCKNGKLFAVDEFFAVSAEEISAGPGDVLLMLADSWNAIEQYKSSVENLRGRGVFIVSGVHDLIPELYPHACHQSTVSRYDAWFRHMLLYSDAVLAVSQTVAQEFETFVIERELRHRSGLRIGWFHNGSDMAAQNAGDVREKITRPIQGDAPVFLCVGTLEPRKGHRIALRAFDSLWRAGVDARLVFAGRRGWYDEALVRDIASHPEFGCRLAWVDDADDSELDFLYRRAAALICPSFAEGFGLPIVEAARRGRPVICSDIKVFREIGKDGALYFRANDADALADCVRGFLAGKRVADPARILRSSWADAADRIASIVEKDQWSGRLP
jgi:glycosyltransferase involved in cell wall biosynthesis